MSTQTKTLSYKAAKQLLEYYLETMPWQWSMHPYAGGFICGLCSRGLLTAKVADKLWDEYAHGI